MTDYNRLTQTWWVQSQKQAWPRKEAGRKIWYPQQVWSVHMPSSSDKWTMRILFREPRQPHHLGGHNPEVSRFKIRVKEGRMSCRILLWIMNMYSEVKIVNRNTWYILNLWHKDGMPLDMSYAAYSCKQEGLWTCLSHGSLPWRDTTTKATLIKGSTQVGGLLWF